MKRLATASIADEMYPFDFVVFVREVRLVVEPIAVGFFTFVRDEPDLDATVDFDPPLAELLFAAAGFVRADEALVVFVEALLGDTFFGEPADEVDLALVAPDLEADAFVDVAFLPDDLDAPAFEAVADLAFDDFLVVAMILFSSV